MKRRAFITLLGGRSKATQRTLLHLGMCLWSKTEAGL
jgi:hypothetical protein